MNVARSIGLLSAVEHAARFVLRRRGFASRTVATPGGSLHVYDAVGAGSLPRDVAAEVEAVFEIE